MVGVPMLYGGFKGLGERDWRIKVKAVDTRSAAGQFFTYDGRSIELVRKWLASKLASKVPCAEEVIF